MLFVDDDEGCIVGCDLGVMEVDALTLVGQSCRSADSVPFPRRVVDMSVAYILAISVYV